MYKTTIKGIAAKLKKNNNINEDININSLIIFNWLEMFSWKFTFIENKFNLLIINIERTTEIIHKEYVLLKIELKISDFIRGIEAIKIAVIGVGSPMNESFWFLSILKFANLRAANIGIRKAIKEILENGVWKGNSPNNWVALLAFISLNKIKEGASPDVIKSAKLSSCNPNSFSIFKSLAKNPSKKSIKIPRKIKSAARTNWLLNIKIIESIPQHRLAIVM